MPTLRAAAPTPRTTIDQLRERRRKLVSEGESGFDNDSDTPQTPSEDMPLVNAAEGASGVPPVDEVSSATAPLALAPSHEAPADEPTSPPSPDEVATPASPVVGQEGQTSARTTGTTASTEPRSVAAAKPRREKIVSVTLQMSTVVHEHGFVWERMRREQGVELSQARLWTAALFDIPVDPQEAEALVLLYPEAAPADTRTQTTARLAPEIRQRLKDLAFELKASQTGLTNWEVIAAAIARQFEAEGCPLPKGDKTEPAVVQDVVV